MSKYKDQYEQLHNNGQIYHGASLRKHKKHIGKLVKDTNSKSLLDYGSGKGLQYTKKEIHKTHFNGIMPVLYDIGIPEYSTLPEGRFDGIFSVDVMEHIPENELDAVFEYIYSRVNKFVYLAICTIPAPDLLPNGEQSHVTLKPMQWWINKIMPHANVYSVIHCYGIEKQTKIINRR